MDQASAEADAAREAEVAQRVEEETKAAADAAAAEVEETIREEAKKAEDAAQEASEQAERDAEETARVEAEVTQREEARKAEEETARREEERRQSAEESERQRRAVAAEQAAAAEDARTEQKQDQQEAAEPASEPPPAPPQADRQSGEAAEPALAPNRDAAEQVAARDDRTLYVHPDKQRLEAIDAGGAIGIPIGLEPASAGTGISGMDAVGMATGIVMGVAAGYGRSPGGTGTSASASAGSGGAQQRPRAAAVGTTTLTEGGDGEPDPPAPATDGAGRRPGGGPPAPPGEPPFDPFDLSTKPRDELTEARERMRGWEPPAAPTTGAEAMDAIVRRKGQVIDVRDDMMQHMVVKYDRERDDKTITVEPGRSGWTGETVGLYAAFNELGLNMRPFQNTSNNGADGLLIDRDNGIVYVVEAKYSKNGVNAAAGPGAKSPKERCLGWAEKGESWDPDMHRELQHAIDNGFAVIGIHVPVGKKPGGYDLRLNSWGGDDAFDPLMPRAGKISPRDD
ncbi:hypothetical protein E5A73_11895 [Sphingomonas gei]|uniref:Uncharacterized protein n=1 Tax=Sphingomonas gei TaxID=1395960 RepID=A0A4S1XDJ0_9SPHN|nr:hypothetical protein [Sphingomonas gei]TGX53530.1 hypothetical protein E5A73_11895 [Sphingomonas gei]